MENKLKVDFIKTSSEKVDDVKKDNPGAFIHSHNENEDNLYIGGCRITDNFNIGNKDASLKTISLGGLEESTLGELSQKSVSQLLYEILCPTVQPTVKSQPSIFINYVGGNVMGDEVKHFIEVGSHLPVAADFTATPNRGKFSDGTPYAGECGEIEIVMNPEDFDGISDEKIYRYNAVGTFEDGPIPNDSHDKPCPDLQYKGGEEVSSNTYKLVSVYPIYINDIDITEMNPHYVNYIDGETFYVNIPAEIDESDNKFKVYLPSEFSEFTVSQYDTIQQIWTPIIMELIEGETCKYIRTTDEFDFQGVSKYEIRVKK